MNDLKYMDAFEHDFAKRKADFQRKLVALRAVLKEQSLDALVLSYGVNFSWLTNGARNLIFTGSEVGVASLYVDATRVVVLTNNIEGHRFLNEEFRGLEGEITSLEDQWYEERSAVEKAKFLAKSEKVAEDASSPVLEARLGEVRTPLSQYEMDIFRQLGHECGEVIGEVARSILPGMTEWQIAGVLTGKLQARAIEPVVLLVAADERVNTSRHALPTTKRVKNKVMLVVCGRRAGLILNVTRMIYITTTPNATVPEDLLRRHEAATYVEAAVIARTRTAGIKGKDMFKTLQEAYAEKGYADEWKLHHQGGCTGYQSREWVANPSVERVTGTNQAYTWNPSITGTKSEDTILCYNDAAGKAVIELISVSPDWPMIKHTIGDFVFEKPAILHIAL
ncbi:hypothetical protein BBJ28_00004914 [Nothophytophthora sp. Chile5]|nr:hypothetical protein BBJ28_00004914 [Nothophytophthora sp. Chile5]